jgi:hypothetical protein
MSLLEENQRRVRNLSPKEIWLFIVGRVLLALGLGILAMAYFPSIAFPAALPLIGVGVVFLMIAFKGYGRKELRPK